MSSGQQPSAFALPVQTSSGTIVLLCPSPPPSEEHASIRPRRTLICPPNHLEAPSSPSLRRPRSRTTGGILPRHKRTYSQVFSNIITEMTAPDSPPPYSPSPPEPVCIAPVQRASSSPHLRPPPSVQLFTYSNTPSSSSLGAHLRPNTHTPPSYSQSTNRVTHDEELEDSVASEDDMLYAVRHTDLTGTLRSRLLKRKRVQDDTTCRPITTANGVLGGGETETEGEESPRNLPTSRITQPALSPFTYTGLPSWLVPFLFSFSRLLSIVPAIFGTLWNVYHVIWPPGPRSDMLGWRVEFFVSVLWSILTGWQCLQLTTGLLKRWRVYYSPLPTLIRLFALQAICWPATHLTLTLLNHEKRPALCWAVIGTTTCYSRSIQLWVTSNIGPAPPPAVISAVPSPTSLRRSVLASAGGMRDEWMRLRRRRWDWGEVGRKCVLPAGIVYFVMAWMDLLRKEWERGLR